MTGFALPTGVDYTSVGDTNGDLYCRVETTGGDTVLLRPLEVTDRYLIGRRMVLSREGKVIPYRPKVGSDQTRMWAALRSDITKVDVLRPDARYGGVFKVRSIDTTWQDPQW